MIKKTGKIKVIKVDKDDNEIDTYSFATVDEINEETEEESNEEVIEEETLEEE